MMDHAHTGIQNITRTEFDQIAALANAEFGLKLPAEKIAMIQSRLRKRLRSLSINSFSEYYRHVTSDHGGDERRKLISALTTNVSHFYRETHHFDLLKQKFLPEAIARLKSGGRVRIWSAGCSNGQEACTVAMVFLKAEPRIAEWDFRILGTDIDPEVVKFADVGIYPERMFENVQDADKRAFFVEHTTASGTAYHTNETLKRIIRFRELNLLQDWPMRQGFDVIFCRNVVIYFDSETQAKLWPRFRNALTPEGRLLLGHSERIVDPEASGFTLEAATTYRRDTSFSTAT